MDALKQTLSKFKFVIIGVVVVIIAMVLYNIFVLQPKKANNADAIRSENQSIVSTELGREIVSTLNRLKGISIDPEFFEEDAFVRLIDFSVEIQPQNVGKYNPFKAVDLFGQSQDEIEGAEVLDDVTEQTNTTEDSTEAI